MRHGFWTRGGDGDFFIWVFMVPPADFPPINNPLIIIILAQCTIIIQPRVVIIVTKGTVVINPAVVVVLTAKAIFNLIIFVTVSIQRENRAG